MPLSLSLERERKALHFTSSSQDAVVFGLIMHIGTGGKKSKTQAVYYPPKLLGKGEIQLVKEGDTFTIRDGYIAFTKKFRYLGSIINSDLRDIHEIKKRIQKATNQMHELTHLWKNKHIKKLGITVWL